eukprot:TRINITY_DN2642_c0_g2_i1.p1 TRINITY_DN2642_c0_g2~~TRINITY_DN2642_c0_g2_i1.p1  ORF type:complete len:1017 (+),score=421.46 TRINITY_DN2642_c0_g2_i1:41-3052(+)
MNRNRNNRNRSNNNFNKSKFKPNNKFSNKKRSNNRAEEKENEENNNIDSFEEEMKDEIKNIGNNQENNNNEENDENDEENDEEEDDNEGSNGDEDDGISENDEFSGINKLNWKSVNVPSLTNKDSLADLFVRIEEYQPQEGEKIVFGKNLLNKMLPEKNKKRSRKEGEDDEGDDQDNDEDEVDENENDENNEEDEENDENKEGEGEEEEEIQDLGKMKEEKKYKVRGSDMDKQFFPQTPKAFNPTPEEIKQIESDMKEWIDFNLDIRILKALHDKKFFIPTEIQKRALISSIRDFKDIIGAAETGSGKTLAFGIPMLHIWWRDRQKTIKKFKEENNIVDDENDPNKDCFIPGEKKKDKKMVGLILTPTRELAVQITKHLLDISVYLPVRIVSIIGGISEDKQLRLLNNRPEIVVATPGRFWDLFSKHHDHLATYPSIRFLIFDEADRMVSAGHFRKLYSLLGRLPEWKAPISKKKQLAEEEEKKERENRKRQIKRRDPLANKEIYKLDAEEVNEDQKWLVKLGYSMFDDNSDVGKLELEHKRCTYLYSATLTLNMKERSMSTKHILKSSKNNKKAFIKNMIKGKQADSQEKLEESLIKKMDFHNKIELIDLTSETRGVASSVSEAKIECSEEMKDNYLFYFLKRYCGMGHKTIVFVNTISTIRKLLSLYKLLGLSVFGIHGQMHQKQRLKNLDKFTKQTDTGNVLIATDVASRGIDIPKVDHVVHYQIASSAEVYIHRSGRTGRAGEEGVSLSLVSPSDVSTFKHLSFSLNNKKWIRFPIEPGYIDRIANLISKSKQLDQLHQKKRKETAGTKVERGIKKIDTKNEVLQDDEADSDEEAFYKKLDQDKLYTKRVSQLENEIKMLTQQPLIPRGVSTSFITKGKEFEEKAPVPGEKTPTRQKLEKMEYALKVIDKENKVKEDRSALEIIKKRTSNLPENQSAQKKRDRNQKNHVELAKKRKEKQERKDEKKQKKRKAKEIKEKANPNFHKKQLQKKNKKQKTKK